MKKQDAITSICWVVLGLIISIWSVTFPFGSLESLGPALFPLGSGLILVILGSILFFQAQRKNEGKPLEKSLVPLIPRGAAFSRVALSLAGMFLSALLIEFLGFLLTFFFLILFLVRGIQPQKWGADIFYALFATLSAYMLFQVLLQTMLPTGFLGF